MHARLLLFACLLAVGLVAWLLLGGEDAPPAVPGEAATDRPASSAPGPALQPAGGADGRTRLGDPASRGTATGIDAAPDGALPDATARPTPPAVRWSAVVRTPDGHPAIGARVDVQTPDGTWHVRVADGEGRVTLDTVLGRHPVRVSGGADGVFEHVGLLVDGPEGALTLEEPARLVVVLRRGADAPAGVPVALERDGLETVRARSDARGEAPFDGLLPGDWTVRIAWPDGPVMERRLTLRGGRSARMPFEAPGMRALRGTVRAGADGPPVVDARVVLHVRADEGGSPVRLRTRTDLDGAFVLRLGGGTPVHLGVEHADYAPWPAQGSPLDARALARHVADASPVEVVLATGYTIAGRVLGPDERPLAGVAVRLLHAQREVTRLRTATDGTFVREHLAPGSYRVDVPGPDWFLRDGLVLVPLLGGGTATDVDVHVLAARTLHGVVRGAGGTPVSGARVWVDLGGFDNHGPLETWSDARGWWRLTGLPPGGRGTLQATAGERRAPPTPIGRGDGPYALDLEPTGRLEGVLRDDADGEPVAGAAMTLTAMGSLATRRTATTAADGRFVVADLPPGRWHLSIHHAAYRPIVFREVLVDAGTGAPIELRLDPGEVYAGVVLDDAGAPVGGATLALRGTPGDGTRAIQRATTADDQGAFRFAGLPPGRYTLTASHPGHRPASRADLTGGHPAVRLILLRR